MTAPAPLQPSTHAPGRSEPAGSFLADVADLVIAVLKPIAVPALRLALGVVYVWFGVLKIIGASPIADLVAAMVPFLPADAAVIGMGAVEVALGAALIVGVLVPWVAAAQVLHLMGTFAVFVFQPAAVHDGNPLLVSLEGEFIAKNLVLIAGLFVVAAFSGPKPWAFLGKLRPGRG